MSQLPSQAELREYQQQKSVEQLQKSALSDATPFTSKLATVKDSTWLAPIDLHHTLHNRLQHFKTTRLSFSIISVMYGVYS